MMESFASRCGPHDNKFWVPKCAPNNRDPDKTLSAAGCIPLSLATFSCHPIQARAGPMRTLGILILLGGLAIAQENAPSKPTLVAGSHPSRTDVVIPAGTKLRAGLTNRIPTK